MQEPKDDLISKLVVEQVKPGHLAKEDAVQTAFLLLVAGNATMVNMIALVSPLPHIHHQLQTNITQGVVTLSQNPSTLAELKSNPSLSRAFVEELCRYHTASALAMKRTAKEDVEIGGKKIKAGEGIIASNQSANRDEEVFEHADKFDIHRKWPEGKDPLGFGYGEHRCVAEDLSKAELRIVFETLYQKLPELNIASEVKFTPLDKDVGVVELPVTF